MSRRYRTPSRETSDGTYVYPCRPPERWLYDGTRVHSHARYIHTCWDLPTLPSALWVPSAWTYARRVRARVPGALCAQRTQTFTFDTDVPCVCAWPPHSFVRPARRWHDKSCPRNTGRGSSTWPLPSHLLEMDRARRLHDVSRSRDTPSAVR